MTWITLHNYGRECWCDFSNHIQLERNAFKQTHVGSIDERAYDETPEQIIALIAEAERGADPGSRPQGVAPMTEKRDTTTQTPFGKGWEVASSGIADPKPPAGQTGVVNSVQPTPERIAKTSEQINALIAEAEREPPKIDAQRVWNLCAALHAQAELLGSCSITSPARIHMQKRIDEMRADIKKELGL